MQLQPNQTFGFAYAIDDAGNWLWGKYFINDTLMVNNLTTCHLDFDDNLLMGGFADGKPVLLSLQPLDGTVNEMMVLSDGHNTTVYSSFKGLYHYKASANISFVFASFLLNSQLTFTRINMSDLSLSSFQIPGTFNSSGLIDRWDTELRAAAISNNKAVLVTILINS